MNVRYEVEGSTAWVTVDRPEARNAMTFGMYEQLVSYCERVDADDQIESMVVSGAGGKAFIAGTDINEFTRFETPEDGVDYERRVDAVLDRLEAVRKPTVAFVEGAAMGAGLAIAAACDVRVVTPDATFGMPIARTVGNCLSMANYVRLSQALGAPRLKDLIFTTRRIDAEEALAIGFAGAIVEPAEADDALARLCALLAEHSATTLWVTKEALRRARTVPEGDDLIRLAYGSEAFRVNVRRFLGPKSG
jgi:enoyl-CoA hydratase/carnithine racemase